MSSEVSGGVATPSVSTTGNENALNNNFTNITTSGEEGNVDTSYRVSQIEYVQQLIEECLKLYMDKFACIQQIILTHPNIQPGFINLMWGRLEQQNPEFFRSYNQLLYLKRQIHLFNSLANLQVKLMQQQDCNFVSSPTSQRTNQVSNINQQQFNSPITNQLSSFSSLQGSQAQPNQFSSGQSTTSSQPNTPTNAISNSSLPFGSTSSPSFNASLGFPNTFNLQGGAMPNSGLNIPLMNQNNNFAPLLNQFGPNLLNYQNNPNFFNMQALANQNLLNNSNLFLQMSQGLGQGMVPGLANQNQQALQLQQMVQNSQSGFPTSMSPSFNSSSLIGQNVRMQHTKQENNSSTQSEGKSTKNSVSTPVNSTSDSNSNSGKQSPVVTQQQSVQSPMIQGNHINPLLSSFYGSGPNSGTGSGAGLNSGFSNSGSFGLNQSSFPQNLNNNLLSQYPLNQLLGNSGMMNPNQMMNLKNAFFDPQQFRALVENQKSFTEDSSDKNSNLGKSSSDRTDSNVPNQNIIPQGMPNFTPQLLQQLLKQQVQNNQMIYPLSHNVLSPQSNGQSQQKIQTPNVASGQSSKVSTPVVQTPQIPSSQTTTQNNWKASTSGGSLTPTANVATNNSNQTVPTPTSQISTTSIPNSTSNNSQTQRKRKSPTNKGSRPTKRRKDENASSAPSAPSSQNTKDVTPSSIQPNTISTSEHFSQIQSVLIQSDSKTNGNSNTLGAQNVQTVQSQNIHNIQGIPSQINPNLQGIPVVDSHNLKNFSRQKSPPSRLGFNTPNRNSLLPNEPILPSNDDGVMFQNLWEETQENGALYFDDVNDDIDDDPCVNPYFDYSP